MRRLPAGVRRPRQPGLRHLVSASLALVAASVPARTRAEWLAIPPDLARDVLAESNPGALAPDDRDADDYELAWEATPVTGARASIEPGSLQWVRVATILALPRGRLRIEVKGALAGHVIHAGAVTPMAIQNDMARVTVPVALLAGPDGAVDVAVQRAAAAPGALPFVEHGRLRLVHRARSPAHGGVSLDPTCSPWGLAVEASGLPAGAWLSFGCRAIVAGGEHGRTASVEIVAYWDGAAGLRLDGVPIELAMSSAALLRVRAEPNTAVLSRGDPPGPRFGPGATAPPTGAPPVGAQVGTSTSDGSAPSVRLRWRVPDRFPRMFIGAGVGPYWYDYAGVDPAISTVTGLLTVYGSWWLSETARIVFFDAVPLHRRTYTDFGLYLNSESTRLLDRRVTLNVMLGAHALVVDGGEKALYRIGFPQGFEIIVRDLFLRGGNLGGGAFIYPDAFGDAYYNTWLRWGTGRGFVEFNYLEWQLPGPKGLLRSRAAGLCVGVPLWRGL